MDNIEKKRHYITPLKDCKCAICGTPFQSSRAYAKYCSPACKRKGANLRQHYWRINHQDKMRESWRTYEKKHQLKEQNTDE